MGKSEFTSGAICPDCGKRNDGFTHMSDPNSAPSPGTVGVCAYCSCVSIYEAAGTLRKVTQQEWKYWEQHAPEVMTVLKKAIQATLEFQLSQQAKNN